MEEIKQELERIIVEINNQEKHLKRESYPINNIKEHLLDVRNRMNNISERIKDNPAYEEVSKKLSEYSEKITLVLTSGEVFKMREKAIIVLKWISDSVLLIKNEKSEERETAFLLNTWKVYNELLDFIKIKFFGKNEFLEKEFLEYAENNKKQFFDVPKNENITNYYTHCIILTVRKLSFSKESHHDTKSLEEIENVMKDMNTSIFERIRKSREINKKDYSDEMKSIGITEKELKMVLGGFNISREYSKGLIGLLLAKNIQKLGKENKE